MVLKAFDADDFIKPLKCLLLMRKTCVDKDPAVYNDWVREFKKELPVEKVGFWQLLVNGQYSVSFAMSVINRIYRGNVSKFSQVKLVLLHHLNPISAKSMQKKQRNFWRLMM